MKRIVVNKGDKYGKLSVISELAQKGSIRIFSCECDCGEVVSVRLGNLRSRDTQSCGCLQKERASISCTKHGLAKTTLYRRWAHMIGRCSNPNDARYKLYGGRGISVCVEWLDFNNFNEWAISNGYEDKLTIDRKDNDEGYYPINCRWVTWKVQQNNRRNNRNIVHKGLRMTLQQWSEKTGIMSGTILGRLNNGWSVCDALEKGVRI